MWDIRAPTRNKCGVMLWEELEHGSLLLGMVAFFFHAQDMQVIVFAWWPSVERRRLCE